MSMSSSLNRLIQPARHLIQAQFFKFLDRRSGSQNTHRLTLRNLYIFPTRRGFIFLVFLCVLWLLGTNYQNNLILALAFLLISIFVVSILHTFSNLAGLELSLNGAANAFVGERVDFFISVGNTSKRASLGLQMRWQESDIYSDLFDCEANSDLRVRVGLVGNKRGHVRPRRLMVESVYPLGLLRCWTWLKFDAHALVYPKPIEFPLENAANIDDEGDGEHPMKGGEDFSAFREYQPGDPIKHIAWKLYSRDRGLYTKEFSQSVSREMWLNYFNVKAEDPELKLSALCFWALAFSQQDENYGLMLPGKKIAPNKGENHKAKVLAALAEFSV